jgi:hypothetical protein
MFRPSTCLPGTTRLGNSSIKHALEGGALLRKPLLALRHGFEGLGEEGLEVAPELFKVSSTVPQGLARRLVVKHGEQEMFQREELVPSFDCLACGQVDGCLQLFGDHRH